MISVSVTDILHGTVVFVVARAIAIMAAIRLAGPRARIIKLPLQIHSWDGPLGLRAAHGESILSD